MGIKLEVEWERSKKYNGNKATSRIGMKLELEWE